MQGIITDVKDGTPVPDARIILSAGMDTAYSDAGGVFQLIQGGTDFHLLPGLTGTLVSRQSLLAWQFNVPVEIRIYNQLGSLSFSSGRVNEFGRMALPGLRDGYYFVLVHSEKGNRFYSLVISGKELLVGDYAARYPDWGAPVTDLADSLRIEHRDFFSRSIGIKSGSAYTEIELLRHQYDELDYLNNLICTEAFRMLSSSPPSGHLGEVESVKLIYNRRSDNVFFMNSNKYQNHYRFAVDFMGYTESMGKFVSHQYTNSPARYLYPATLNYYKSLGIYTFEFFSGDGATCEDVNMLYAKLKEHSFLRDELLFYPSNDTWLPCDQVPSVSANELFSGQNYQAMNVAENYGYLRKVPLENLSEVTLAEHDILLVDGIPFDIPVLSGIITTEYQTPLSHINVLSYNRGTPNMCLRDGFENSMLDSLIGRLVYLSVEYDNFILRPAEIEEARAFWEASEPSEAVILTVNRNVTELVDLDEIDYSMAAAVGGKAANFSEMLNAFRAQGMDPPVPEGYFAIPFSWYLEHIQTHHIDKLIEDFLSDDSQRNDPAKCRQALETIRESITEAPLSPDLLNRVKLHIENTGRFDRFRFRSSTNAEDLEGFNGAGLYDSYTASVSGDPRTIDAAIKKVWASLWNFNAFEEREYFRIDHMSCAMAVLVHRSFPDEDANGVAITRNPYNTNHGFVINVQWGENSIVDPEPGVLHDQIILYTYSLNGRDPFTYEYISNSNLLPAWADHVLSREELFLLGDYLLLLKEYFYAHVYDCGCRFEDYGLDVEFKIDSEVSPRKLYIKQVRPY